MLFLMMAKEEKWKGGRREWRERRDLRRAKIQKENHKREKCWRHEMDTGGFFSYYNCGILWKEGRIKLQYFRHQPGIGVLRCSEFILLHLFLNFYFDSGKRITNLAHKTYFRWSTKCHHVGRTLSAMFLSTLACRKEHQKPSLNTDCEGGGKSNGGRSIDRGGEDEHLRTMNQHSFPSQHHCSRNNCPSGGGREGQAEISTCDYN